MQCWTIIQVEMERLSFEEAKRLSIKKWQMHVDADGLNLEVKTDKELSELISNCGFCERHFYVSRYDPFNCSDCEFGKVGGFCWCNGSLYHKWYWSYSKESAQKILDVIKNLEE